MECGGHHRKRALQPLARKFCKTAAVGEARGMHNRIYRAEGGARGTDELGSRAGASEIAGAKRDLGAGALAFRRDRLQPLQPRRVGPLPVQHQALILTRKPPRDGGADAGSASGDDGNPHAPLF